MSLPAAATLRSSTSCSRRGLEVNAREKGDNTYAMHWAAAGGHLDVVRRLAEAGVTSSDAETTTSCT